MKRFVKLLLIVISLCYTISSQAQPTETKEVMIHQQIGSRYFRCFIAKNMVYDNESFKTLMADKECSMARILKVDFTKQSLIGYRVGGDCFMQANSKVFRNDSTKTYQVKIFNYWGGCRAGGTYVGWLVIDKIPNDYKVEFSQVLTENLRDNSDKFISDNSLAKQSEFQTLESREIDLKGCIPTYFNKQFVIKDEATYLKAIRNDASRERCVKDVEKIDFEKNSLLGIEINSGYCRRPLGLEFQVIKDEKSKEYLFNISYDDPKGSTCRALSQYDLWILVPKVPVGFEVKFEVKPK